jgi:hypothetical protein
VVGLVLIAILILSGTISVNAVELVMGATVLFGSIFLAYLAACLLPGYAHARAASLPGTDSSQAVRRSIPGQHVNGGAGMLSLPRHDVSGPRRLIAMVAEGGRGWARRTASPTVRLDARPSHARDRHPKLYDHECHEGKLAGENVDDATVTASVKTKLAAEKPATLTKVDVDTNTGTVYLTGNLENAAIEARPTELARKSLVSVKSSTI